MAVFVDYDNLEIDIDRYGHQAASHYSLRVMLKRYGYQFCLTIKAKCNPEGAEHRKVHVWGQICPYGIL